MPFDEDEKQKLIEETHAIVSIRGDRFTHTNFVEVGISCFTTAGGAKVKSDILADVVSLLFRTFSQH